MHVCSQPVGYTRDDHCRNDCREKGRDVAHKTLGSFAREQKQHRRTTALAALEPALLEEVTNGYREGINITVIAKWLRDEHGIEGITVPKIRYHMEVHNITWGEALKDRA